MRSMTANEMQSVNGGGFWSGFLCGGLLVLTVGEAVSPEPVSKFAFGELVVGTAAACGFAFS